MRFAFLNKWLKHIVIEEWPFLDKGMVSIRICTAFCVVAVFGFLHIFAVLLVKAFNAWQPLSGILNGGPRFSRLLVGEFFDIIFCVLLIFACPLLCFSLLGYFSDFSQPPFSKAQRKPPQQSQRTGKKLIRKKITTTATTTATTTTTAPTTVASPTIMTKYCSQFQHQQQQHQYNTNTT